MSEEKHVSDCYWFALDVAERVGPHKTASENDPDGRWRAVIGRELSHRDEAMRKRFEQEKTLATTSLPRAVVEIWPGDKVILEVDERLTAQKTHYLQDLCTSLCPGVKFLILDAGVKVRSVVHKEGKEP